MGRLRAWADLPDGTALASRFQLFNSPDHGSGADLLKACLVVAYAELPEEARIIVAIHDEILLEVPEGLVAETSQRLKGIMESTGNEMFKPVPIMAEITVGDAWAQ